MALPILTLSAVQLGEMLDDAARFRAEALRFAECEKTEDITLDREKRLDLRRRVIEIGFLWKPKDLSAAEVDLFYGMVREAARIGLARTSAAFRAKYGIALTCGDEPDSTKRSHLQP